MSVRFSGRARRDLARLDPPVRERILAAAARLPDGDVRRLAGGLPIRFRLRVGDWRLIFRRDETAGSS